MGFLAPLFLAGTAALLVPIIIHLVHRQKPRGTPFPSLMFLQRIPYKAQRRQRIRHWALFLLRCAAILLLALAFARPWIEGVASGGAGGTGGRDVVVLVDRSFSMGYGGHWDQALREARQVVSDLTPDDRAAIVFFDDQAEASSALSADPTALLAAIDRQPLGAGVTRYGPALRLAQRMLEESEMPRREVVLISDFQQVGRTGDDLVRLPSGVVLTPVDLSTPESHNVAVASVTVSQEVVGGRERSIIAARIINTGTTTAKDIRAHFELNGRELQTRTVTIEPQGAAMAVFDAILVPDLPSRGIVRVDADDLVADDTFHFVLSPGRAVSVLLLEGSRPRANQSLYLRRALGVGDQPPFRVTVKALRALQLTDFDEPAVVVLNDAAIPGGRAGERLRRFVVEGGGLLVAAGEGAPARWPAELTDLFPGTLGGRVERFESRGGAVTHLELGHPVLEVFSAPRSGDFSGSKVYRYRQLVMSGNAGVLARYDDGGVALAERRVGEGRVLVWTTTFDTYWTDVPLQPVFLPFAHQLVKFLAGYGEPAPWFTVGKVVDLKGYAAQASGGHSVAAALDAGEEMNVELPSGDRVRVSTTDPLFSGPVPGFYEVRPVAAPHVQPLMFAVNVNPSESDLAPLDVEAFVTGASGGVAADLDAESAGALTPEDQEQRQGGWWYLLLAALAILGLETALSNRLSRAKR